MEQIGEYTFVILEQWAGGEDWNRVLNTPSWKSISEGKRWIAENKTRMVNASTLGTSDLFRFTFVRKESYFLQMFNVSKKTGAMYNETSEPGEILVPDKGNNHKKEELP